MRGIDSGGLLFSCEGQPTAIRSRSIFFSWSYFLSFATGKESEWSGVYHLFWESRECIPVTIYLLNDRNYVYKSQQSRKSNALQRWHPVLLAEVGE